MRPEVKKLVAAVGRLEAITVPELQAVIRAAVSAATGRDDWVASVSTTTGPDRLSVILNSGLEPAAPLRIVPRVV